MTLTTWCGAAEHSAECRRCLLVNHILGRQQALLRIAKSRTVSAADAEDAVQEALTRALERVGDLDPALVDGWLTTVTINLCTDLARDRKRHGHRVVYQLLHSLPEPYVDESVADRAYAASVAEQLATLPPAQAAVLRLRTADLPIEEIADRLGATTKSVESLLSRGRRTMRAIASGMLAVLAGVRLRPRGQRVALHLANAAAVAAASVGAIAALFVAPPATQTQWRNAPLSVSSREAVHRPVSRLAPQRVDGRHDSIPVTRVINEAASASRPAHIEVGPVGVHTRGTYRQRPEQTLVESVQACLTDGVTVSTTYVGCNAAQ